jgi:oxygen-independent coproporphyrinogen-3 oxidase
MRTKNRAFLDALLAEVRSQAAVCALEPETIYFGGGTPSMLSIGELEYLLGGLRECLSLESVREWTFEVNPATVSRAKASRLRELGVNRVSIGAQSWDDEILKTLGRAHCASHAELTYRVLREAGFENINIDLMFAIPGQSREQWRATLQRTMALAPEHISAYCLTYEEDTRFFERLQSGEFHREDERDAAMFEEAMELLDTGGYRQYEISNYARAGRESLHNLAQAHSRQLARAAGRTRRTAPPTSGASPPASPRSPSRRQSAKKPAPARRSHLACAPRAASPATRLRHGKRTLSKCARWACLSPAMDACASRAAGS